MEVIAQYRGSGLSLARFARDQGLRPGRLHYWIYEKGRAKSRKACKGGGDAPVFEEVIVAAPSSEGANWAVEVSLPSGLAVRFGSGAIPQWIGSVVQALQRPC